MLKQCIVIAQTKKGAALATRLALRLQAELRVPRHYVTSVANAEGYDGPVGGIVEACYAKYQVVVLVMSAQVAVRSMSPVLSIQKQQTEPAVLMIDEEGKYVISLFVGVLGEGNQLARELAEFLGGTAVVTTTELNQLPGWETLARKYGLVIEHSESLPRLTTALLNGEPVLVWDDFGMTEIWPEHVRVESGPMLSGDFSEKYMVIIGYGKLPFMTSDVTVLALRPACLVVGIDFVAGVPGARIIGAIRRYFREHSWSTVSIKTLAVPETKALEPGMKEVLKEFGVPVLSFSPEHLAQLYTGKKGGLESCEAVALLGAEPGRLTGAAKDLGQIMVAVAIVNDVKQAAGTAPGQK